MKLLFFYPNRYFLCYLWFFVSLLSCSRYPKDIEQSLKYAGDNRAELEKVLKHYGQKSEDSLKYKAAMFLIENMVYHKSFVSKELPNTINVIKSLALKLKSERSEISEYRAATIAFDSIRSQKGHGLGLYYDVQFDIHHIDADYLIDNIDFSFKIWNEVPWGNQISFKTFCEEILPYRIFNEEVKSWRKIYYNQFKSVLDSIPSNYSLVQICRKLYDELQKDTWYHVDDLNISFLPDPLTMINYRYGSCKEKAAFTLYAMRALCISGSLDMYIQNPDKLYPYHFWNQMKDNSGSPIEFLIGDQHLYPAEKKRDSTRKKGVIYRSNFSLQKESLPIKYKIKKRDIPERLDFIFLSNVSEEYFPDSKIELAFENNDNEILFLCLFNNKTWIPVTFAKIENSKATFKGLESDIVYMPAYYKKRSIIPVNTPFLLSKRNDVHYFHPDTNNKRTVILERKHPLPTNLYHLKRFLIGGRFEGANHSDFSDAEILHIISDANDLKKTYIQINTNKKYKYVRYISAKNGRCNMAELLFFSQDSVQLNGRVIGTEGSHNFNFSRTKEAVFDNDPLTFFESHLPSDSWVGLDFGAPQFIKQIVFQFRNDDNLIRKDEVYELFYFTKNGVVSLGRKVGTDEQILIYNNVPENSLLWLRNHTRGREERIFIYKDSKQFWW